jgi:hypothetical protein
VVIGLALAGLVGRALSRSGSAFLRAKFNGQDGVADAVDRLLVVAFYLLAAGFIALTTPAGARIDNAGQALRLLSGKLGELLLVLGALHLASTLTFARLRGGRSSATQASAEDAAIFTEPGSGSSPAAGDTGIAGLRSARPPARAAANPASSAHAAGSRATRVPRIPPHAGLPPTSA